MNNEKSINKDSINNKMRKGQVSSTVVTAIIVLLVLIIISIILYYNKNTIFDLIKGMFGKFR